jgi:hypothetical protein
MAFTSEARGMMLVGTPPEIADSWIVMFVTQDGGQHWLPARIDPKLSHSRQDESDASSSRSWHPFRRG